MNKKIYLDYPNLTLKQFPNNSKNLFAIETCKVAVNYWIYDKKKRIVVHSGSSRACGCNHHKTSIHAEQRALEYLRKHNMIKAGSNAPHDVLRQLYQSSHLAGEINNKSNDNLIHNYLAEDNN